MKIGILDYGMGNIGSIQNMLRKLAHEAEFVDSAAQIPDYKLLILPGVGSYDEAIRRLQSNGMWEALDHYVKEGQGGMLGICLGMQLLLEQSEEGKQQGFGWIPGQLKKFDPQKVRRIPHMGWSAVQRRPGILKNESLEEEKYYFVHSYFATNVPESNVLFDTHYDQQSYTSGVVNKKVLGFQFHPEKSHKYGLALFGQAVDYLLEER